MRFPSRQLVCDYGIVLFVCLIYCCHSAEKQSACNITKGTHSYVWRQVDQNGFHLELTIGVEVMLTKWSTEGRCSALIVHQFPPGMFSSPDELRNLDAFLKHSSFLIPGRVDIESHASNSEGHRVFIFLRMNLTDNLLVGKTRFPARLRYHSPMEVQDDETPLEATVQLPGPRLLLRCDDMELSQPCLRESVRAPCTSKNQTQCTWMGLKYQTNSGVLKLTIPVGDLNHSTLVMMLTFLATGVSSFYLVTVMFQKSKEFHFVLFLARRTGMPANETNQLHLGKDRGDSAQPQRASLETRKSQ